MGKTGNVILLLQNQRTSRVKRKLACLYEMVEFNRTSIVLPCAQDIICAVKAYYHH